MRHFPHLVLLLTIVDLVLSNNTCIVVSTAGEAIVAASGTYCEDGMVNGSPRYRQLSNSKKPYWLYRAVKEVWSFTANESGIEKGKGTIVSKEKSSGSPIGLTYKYYVKSSSTWSIDTSFFVRNGDSIDVNVSSLTDNIGDLRSASGVENAIKDSKTSAPTTIISDTVYEHAESDIEAEKSSLSFTQTLYPHFSGSLELTLAVRAADGTKSRLLIEVPMNLDGTMPLSKASFEYTGTSHDISEQFQNLCSKSIPSEYIDQIGGVSACTTILIDQFQDELHKNILSEKPVTE